jgi:toxin YoeB
VNLSFAPQAWADYTYWQGTDERMVARINELLQDTIRNPFTGLGKPEPLKHNWKGFWSRRIDAKHRLVYRATADAVLIAQCRFHY